MKKLLLIILYLNIIGLIANSQESKLIDVGEGYCKTSINTAVFRQGSIVSNDSLQYISYYDPDGFVTVGKRKLGTAYWEIKKTSFRGNVMDAHNVISIGLDSGGILHLAFDHHGSPLHYTRTVAPGSLEFLPLQSMDGINEYDVTYPEFHSNGNGNLFFVYRSGSSGKGNMIIKIYDPGNQTWETLHENLIDGENKRNAYWQMFIDQKGVIHLSWVWRESWLVETNHDLNYARSQDGGVTWEKSDGTKYSLPITIDTAEVAWKIPQNSELINQTSMTADINGNPYIATYWRDPDDEIPQYRLVWKDGKNWQMATIGNRSLPFSLSGGGTKMIPIARPRVVSDGTMAHYIFRDLERGSKVSIATTLDLRKGQWSIKDLTEFSVDAWEPSHDVELWNNKKQLNIFVQRSHQGDGEKLSDEEESQSPVYVLEYY